MRALQVLLVCLAAACAGHASAQVGAAGKHRDVLTGDAKGPASGNPQCRLFTPAEVGKYLGRAVGAGENAAGGAGCSWSDKDDEAQAILTVVAASYFPEPTLVKGFKRLPNVGKKAWVAPDGGWTAGSLDGNVGVVVNLSGKGATEAAAVAMLQEALKRRSR